ncbi:hypothetical protein EI77_04513 [Prosthecobacter fusiformis]|uniref:Uncharacterized protein n=1 Tax=Prosthecobacter fusiformis TaxID=48464 RepID=A0A4R7RIK9_9BACT|nr:hypothetical protein [Prosthecobacter fusiformis]TDU63091.1 hypothetical protein EI77_04513 [Prosthecobacter fusiformis]
MKPSPAGGLAEKYLAALHTHLSKGPQAGFLAAGEVGKLAVILKMETLGMVKVHNDALQALLLPDWQATKRQIMTNRAELFFAEAIRGIESTHPAAQKSNADLKDLNGELAQCILNLATSKLQLKEGVQQRKAAERELKTSRILAARLLKESQALQEHLQDLVRQILASDEEERHKMSKGLQSEIAQTLLSIHVRLLSLDKELSINDEEFEKAMSVTQGLVKDSVTIINRFVREYGVVYEN